MPPRLRSRLQLALSISLTAVLALAIGHAALANTDSVVDQTGDVVGLPPEGADPADVDLTRISHGHTSGGKLKHTVAVVGAASPQRILLQIGIPDKTGESDACDYAVIRFQGQDQVLNCHTTAKIGKATIEKIAPHRLSFTFTEAVIGHPDAYNWSFVSYWEPFQQPRSDTAPSNFQMRHRL
jgi:hypothetical protein